MKRTLLLITLIACFFLGSCTKDIQSPNFPDVPLAANFAKGADVSWMTQMEAAGIKFYNQNGTAQDLLQILKDKGVNSIRLRVWVNPVNGWCNTGDMIAKAVRAKAMGFRIMLDIHYSDTWADPGQQAIPAAWAGQDISTLKTTVYNYTLEVMNALKDKGITPEWVQLGNETNDGMLWDLGKASVSMENYAGLVQSGYTAVKSVSSASKVIVHLSNGYDNVLFRWMFDGLKANGANWDVIGMSLYPTKATWQEMNKQCLVNMNDMVSRYGTEVMICEVGMAATDSLASKAFIIDMIKKTNSLADGKGLGVFYWEPEAHNGWESYTLGAFDVTGKPTVAMDAFLIDKF